VRPAVPKRLLAHKYRCFTNNYYCLHFRSETPYIC